MKKCWIKDLLVQSGDRYTRKKSEIFSQLTIKTPEQRHGHSSDVFIVNFEQISHIFLVFLLLTLSCQFLLGGSWGQMSNPTFYLCMRFRVIWAGKFGDLW